MLHSFLINKSHTQLQFFKYLLAGGFATLIHLLIFSILNETILPAGVEQAKSVRGWNFFLAFTIAFFLANIVGYITNRRWVFEPGKHSKWTEAGLFYGIATLAYLLSTPLGAYLLGRFYLNEYFVYFLAAIAAIASISVNFFGRKYVVFKH